MTISTPHPAPWTTDGRPGPRRIDRAGWAVWGGLTLAALASGAGEAGLLSIGLAPWVEEVLFRRGLQDALGPRLGAARAAVGSAVAFAGAHLVLVFAAPGSADSQAIGFAIATVLPALAVAEVYRRTGSLGACVGLHAAANAAWALGVGAIAAGGMA
jgi:membrane protease YdiL (CAAX protease family)